MAVQDVADTPSVVIGTRAVHPVGIGTWTMGTGQAGGGDDECVAAIRYSLAHGQNHIDTAEMYGSGRTEQIVGRAMRGTDRASVFIASKLWRNSCTRDGVRPAVEAMLERLETAHLDLLYIHAAWEDLRLRETVAAMCDVVDAGLVRALGVSNFRIDQLREAMHITRHPFVALQNRYNVLYKTDAPGRLLEYCAANGVTMVAYQPVERGRVLHDATVQRIATAHGASPSQVAIAWLLHQDGVVAIPKAIRRDHIDDNIASPGVRLTDDEIRSLGAIPSIM